jgi:hypothetical protein
MEDLGRNSLINIEDKDSNGELMAQRHDRLYKLAKMTLMPFPNPTQKSSKKFMTAREEKPKSYNKTSTFIASK